MHMNSPIFAQEQQKHTLARGRFVRGPAETPNDGKMPNLHSRETLSNSRENAALSITAFKYYRVQSIRDQTSSGVWRTEETKKGVLQRQLV